MPRLQRWNVAIGHFLFRYRNALFPLLFVLTAVTMRPRVFLDSRALDRLVISLGTAIALLGELVRLVTIGYDYIERGGKNKQVYASRLVQGGMYAHTRNPMYLGNALIAIGVTLVTLSPITYLVIIPLFLYIYWTIILAEEWYLRTKFGSEYDDYCARVPRLFPSLRGLRRTLFGTPYDWKRAIRKDLSTLAALLLGLMALPLCRTYFLEGWGSARAEAPKTFGWLLAILGLYGVFAYLKKRRWLFY